MDKISIIPLRGIDVHILTKKGQLGYSFKFRKPTDTEDRSYGQRVTLQGRSHADLISACFLLFASASDTIDALKAESSPDKETC